MKTFEQISNLVTSVAFSPDGRYSLSGGGKSPLNDKGTLKLWEVPVGRLIKTFAGNPGAVSSVAFSPDGRYALSGSTGATLKLWDVLEGREIRTFKGHSAWINSVAFFPHGRFVLSGSRDGTLRIWDIETGNEIVKMISSPDGEWITATPDGYYITSPGGSSLIHWTYTGKKGDKTRSFDQYKSHFNRPDVIQARLSGNLNFGRPAPVMARSYVLKP
jgi:WD40 repeat protein